MKKKVQNGNLDGIKSEFDLNETFSLQNVPKNFRSVSIASLKQVSERVLEKIKYDTNFEPGALQMSLKSVDGQFGAAYNILEGDYTTRLANLRKAYNDGMMALKDAIQKYKTQVSDHRIAFNNYSEANKVINGGELPEELLVPKEEYTRRIEAATSLERRQ